MLTCDAAGKDADRGGSEDGAGAKAAKTETPAKPLVNNAGIFQAVKFEDITEEQWDHMMNANLKSQFVCAQAAAPIIKRQAVGEPAQALTRANVNVCVSEQTA